MVRVSAGLVHLLIALLLGANLVVLLKQMTVLDARRDGGLRNTSHPFLREPQEAAVEWSATNSRRAAVVEERQEKQNDTTTTTANTEADPAMPAAAAATTTNQRSTKDDAVFYNIFVKPNLAHNQRRVIDIIQEQLTQVVDSGAYTQVYYSLLGHNWSHTNERFCVPKLNCTRLEYRLAGYEDVTLQHLHKYCVAHPHARVAYIHDKGSYNTKRLRLNNRNRVVVTKVAVSKQCQDMPSDQCNMCLTKFDTFPHWHAPTNMWAADCSYIAKLIPPRHYLRLRTSMLHDLYKSFSVDKEGITNASSSCLPANQSAFEDGSGSQALHLGRFSNEVWPWTHPDARPCDAFPKHLNRFDASIYNGTQQWEPILTIPSPKYATGSSERAKFYLYEQEFLYGNALPDPRTICEA